MKLGLISKQWNRITSFDKADYRLQTSVIDYTRQCDENLSKPDLVNN